MKKLLPLLLAVLLLAGCTGRSPQQTPTEPVEATEESKGLYDPASSIEAATYGAIRAYPLEQNNYFGLTAMGSRLLLRATDGTMTVLQGDTCVPVASQDTDTDLVAYGTSFDSSVQGAAYYLPDTRQVVLVNPQLQETDRIDLPQDIQGDPCISLVRNEIYYGVPGEVRALNTQTGISRLIRSHSYADQRLQGTRFDGGVLLVRFLEADGTDGPAEYISTQTGRTLYDGQTALDDFYTWQDSYVLCRMDGTVKQTIVGERTGRAQALYLPEERMTSALPMGGVIGYTPGTNGTLRYYNLESGKCTVQVTLYGVEEPAAFLCTQDSLWILANQEEQQVLYRWQLGGQPVEDDTIYTGRLITAEAPDTVGLEACCVRAEQMSDTYGVKIHAWGHMPQNESNEDTFVAEYQVQTVQTMLDDLEAALQQFPEGFLQETVEAGWIHIYLVRSISDGDLSAQYWQEGDCHIVLASQGNTYETFLESVAYAIDSHVLGNSRKFDDWNKLNPEGFFYSYSYGQRLDVDMYLDGEDSAFLSEKAMAYPHDDRSSIFLAAMTASGAEVFDSDVMQAKLLQLCKGIREAYRLEKNPDTYPWEQYLQESLAYTK